MEQTQVVDAFAYQGTSLIALYLHVKLIVMRSHLHLDQQELLAVTVSQVISGLELPAS
jgi:hypothetical protein